MSENRVTVRKANRQDLEAIKAVLVSCKKDPNAADDTVWHREIDAGDVLVAELGGEVKGFGVIRISTITHLYVMKDCQGSGIGAAVLGELEQMARASGADVVGLDSTPCALNFYLKKGYERFPLIENCPPSISVRMFKRLPESSSD